MLDMGILRRTTWHTQTNAPPPTANALMARYLDVTLGYVTARLGAGPEAEDVTAEVFEAAFSILHRCPAPVGLDAEHDPVRAWLFGIARRKVADVLRRRQRRPQTTLSETLTTPAQHSPESQTLGTEAAQTLRAILETLPEPQQEALRLKYVEGLSLSEIAVIMARKPNAIGQLLARARDAVRLRGAAYFGEV